MGSMRLDRVRDESKLSAKKMIHRQFLSFLVIGGGCTLIQYMILYSLTEFLGLAPVISSSIGYVLSAILNYLLNRQLTFGSERKHSESVPRFFAISVAGLIINAVIVYSSQTVGGVHYLIAQIISTIIVLFWNFYANRAWTFNKKYL